MLSRLSALVACLTFSFGCSCSQDDGGKPRGSDPWTADWTEEQRQVRDYAEKHDLAIELRRQETGDEVGGALTVDGGDDQQFLEFLERAPPGAFLVNHVRFTSQTITNLGMQELSRFTHVKEVSLDGSGITNLACLKDLKNLEQLSLRDTAIAGSALFDLSELPKLRSLDLAGCQSVGDQGMTFISQMRNLTDLMLTNTAITDSGLYQLRGMSQLRVLNVVGNPKITRVAVDQVAAALPNTRIYSDF